MHTRPRRQGGRNAAVSPSQFIRRCLRACALLALTGALMRNDRCLFDTSARLGRLPSMVLGGGVAPSVKDCGGACARPRVSEGVEAGRARVG